MYLCDVDFGLNCGFFIRRYCNKIYFCGSCGDELNMLLQLNFPNLNYDAFYEEPLLIRGQWSISKYC